MTSPSSRRIAGLRYCAHSASTTMASFRPHGQFPRLLPIPTTRWYIMDACMFVCGPIKSTSMSSLLQSSTFEPPAAILFCYPIFISVCCRLHHHGAAILPLAHFVLIRSHSCPVISQFPRNHRSPLSEGKSPYSTFRKGMSIGMTRPR